MKLSLKHFKIATFSAYGLFIILVILSVYLYNLINKPLKFDCVLNQDSPCKPEYLRHFASLKLLEFDSDNLISKLKTTFLEIDTISITPQNFNTLNVVISTKKAALNFITPVSQSAISLDGTTLAATSSALPSLILESQIALDEDHYSAVVKLNEYFPQIHNCLAKTTYTLVCDYSTPYKIFINPKGDNFSKTLSTLQLILQKSKMNPNLPLIDLRFDKPVLKPLDY